ncbi:hypothetical protein GJ700_07795 [Duganella sp. FT92W]|uniref:Uncharacterized protein n=1 Tax=Pseudoduganella rivuli TaxID=2666085 RepID=A0A7X2LRV1_9BURK|nr:hypothetical protein [Pseudoduganella rivuli]MRV71626.1 hypothetical protein [Pseudoduganella rivuli]
MTKVASSKTSGKSTDAVCTDVSAAPFEAGGAHRQAFPTVGGRVQERLTQPGKPA